MKRRELLNRKEILELEIKELKKDIREMRKELKGKKDEVKEIKKELNDKFEESQVEKEVDQEEEENNDEININNENLMIVIEEDNRINKKIDGLQKKKEEIINNKRKDREEEFEYDELEETDEEKQKYMESKRRKISKKEIEDLLEEISENELKDLEFEEGTEEITEEIPALYYKLCKQEESLFKEKRETMKTYYDFGRGFEMKLNFLLDEVFEKEKMAISKIYEEVKKENRNHSEAKIKKRIEKARKIFKIILATGGREKINRLKYLNSEDYVKFSFKEIEEWVKNR
jgi:hypothetical protein